MKYQLTNLENLAIVENVQPDKHNFKLYLIFSLSGVRYAISAEQITEIVQLPQLNIIEQMPENIIGLLNLRGQVISVIDIRKFLGQELSLYSTEHQVLILNLENKSVGMIVDSVFNVIQLDEAMIEALPYESTDKYISGIYNEDEGLISVVNSENLLKKFDIQNEFQQITVNHKDLFPKDDFSQKKFKKRALNLQKDIRTDLSANDYTEDKYISFCLSDEIYCISLKQVKEFTKLKNINITPVPCVPDFILGLINLRGEFITIVDIKNFLGIKRTEITDKTKIIVINSTNLYIGILVDEVFDMINIPLQNINNDNSSLIEKDKFILGEIIQENNTVINILNLEKLLEDERLFLEEAV